MQGPTVQTVGASQARTVCGSGFFSSPNPYPKRTSFTYGLAGSQFQVAVTLDFVMRGIQAVEAGAIIDFEIKPEEENRGALDDVVITYTLPNNAKCTLCVQVKHSYDPNGVYKPKDFIDGSKKGKKVGLNTYFQDWLSVDARVRTSDTNILLSNHRLVSDHFTNKGFSDCFTDPVDRNFNGTTLSVRQLKADFINGSGEFSTRKAPNGYNLSKRFSKSGYRKLLFKHLNNTSIPKKKEFLGTLYFQLGAEHVAALEQSLEKSFKKYFRHVNADAIFHACLFGLHQHLRAPEGFVINYQSAKAQLKEWKSEYLDLGASIGETQSWIRQHSATTNDKWVERTVFTNKKLSFYLNRWLKSDKQYYCLKGKPQVGKSSLMARYLRDQTTLYFGQYLVVDVTTCDKALFEKMLAYEDVELLVLDLGNQDRLPDYVNLKKLTPKIMIISRERKLSKYASCLTVSPLGSKEIVATLQAHDATDRVLAVGPKQFRLGDILNSPDTALFHHMQIPAVLLEMIEEAKNLRAAEPNATDDFVPLDLSVRYPAYSCLQLLNFSQPVEWTGFSGSLTILKKDLPETARKVLHINCSKPFKCTGKESPGEIIKLIRPNLSDVQKKAFDAKQLHLVLHSAESMSTWNRHAQNIIGGYAKRVYVTARKHFQHPVVCFEYHQAGDSIYLRTNDRAVLETFGRPAKYLTVGKQQRFDKAVAHELMSGHHFIEADAGAGKSYLLEQMFDMWCHDSRYMAIPWVVLIPLVQLRAEDNRRDLYHLVKRFMLKGIHLPEFIKTALKEDIEHGRVSYLLDGWDELKPHQFAECQKILKALWRQPNIVVATRPSHITSVPLQAHSRIRLHPFNKEQIGQYLRRRFGKGEFFDKAFRVITDKINRDVFALIGVPLLCRLVCDAWEPYKKARDSADDVPLPWSRNRALCKATLYQEFLAAKLMKFLTSHEGMASAVLLGKQRLYRRCSVEIKTMANIAFCQLFGQSFTSNLEGELLEDITTIALLKPLTTPVTHVDQYLFAHQTYAEYLAALNLVAKLVSANEAKRQEAVLIISQCRYQRRFFKIWQFMAGIVSYGDPAVKNADTGLTLFWKCMLAAPKDMAGKGQHDLLMGCIRNSDVRVLESQSYFASLKQYLDEIGQEAEETETPVVQGDVPVDIEAADEEVDDMQWSAESEDAEEELIRRKVSVKFEDRHHFKEHLQALGKIVHHKLGAADKLCRLKSNSFVSLSAQADALAELGVVNDEVQKKLLELMGYHKAGEDRVHAHAVSAWVSLRLPCTVKVIQAALSGLSCQYLGVKYTAGYAIDKLSPSDQAVGDFLHDELAKKKPLEIKLALIQLYINFMKNSNTPDPQWSRRNFLPILKKHIAESYYLSNMLEVLDVALKNNLIELRHELVELILSDKNLGDKNNIMSTVIFLRTHHKLSDAVIKKIFPSAYNKRHVFWHQDAGLPALLELGKYLNKHAVKYLYILLQEVQGSTLWMAITNLASLCEGSEDIADDVLEQMITCTLLPEVYIHSATKKLAGAKSLNKLVGRFGIERVLNLVWNMREHLEGVSLNSVYHACYYIAVQNDLVLTVEEERLTLYTANATLKFSIESKEECDHIMTLLTECSQSDAVLSDILTQEMHETTTLHT